MSPTLGIHQKESMQPAPASATAGIRHVPSPPSGTPSEGIDSNDPAQLAVGARDEAHGDAKAQGWLTSEAIRFAPLHVPRHRRMQTLAVLLWGLILPVCLSFFFFCLSIPPLWPLMFVYIIWMFFDKAPESGGRRSEWFRRLSVWRRFAEYYPVSLIKQVGPTSLAAFTDELACLLFLRVYNHATDHPHGVIGMGAVANFATAATEFPSSFPGIVPHLLTLGTNFNVPFHRDVLLALGICSVSKKSCENILKKGPGNACTIVVGGAAESLAAHPGTADLTLKRRLGFIKIAVRHGADLVPVFSFGENDIFMQLANAPGTKLYTFQKHFQKLFGFTLPVFHGRGVFNYSFGLLPYRHPIVSVVGRPISVKRNPNPSKAELEEYQKRYIAELQHIWDTWKDAYAANRSRELTIVD
ncbi:DAGAT-domain-containing protein [Ceraceosorus guamensis]|uniref:Diacylglycerol O-acyltransferase n=1 Tax=Ceraceosorus guamensis TaxID=1522189 RepID=A0A316VUJ1_9BASI|nr:DAGAT-domain-containing protein [Ceraceosorus guamensis]PWN40558.1 DAGAT-domain-containing protein [Ceraceosorus guamensis]